MSCNQLRVFKDLTNARWHIDSRTSGQCEVNLYGGRSLRVAVVVVCVVPAHAVGVSQAVEGAHRTPPLVLELTTVNNDSIRSSLLRRFIDALMQQNLK